MKQGGKVVVAVRPLAQDPQEYVDLQLEVMSASGPADLKKRRPHSPAFAGEKSFKGWLGVAALQIL